MTASCEQIVTRRRFDVAQLVHGHARVLDVGCGAAKWPGTTGVDAKSSPGVDVEWDLERLPWPFEPNQFDAVLCRDSLEHLENIVGTMEEFHRIVRPGGRVIIVTPHVAHPSSFRDPTHKHHFTLGTFDYFTGGISHPKYSDKQFRMVTKGLTFPYQLSIGAVLARWSTARYEKYYAHRWPPHQMFFALEVVK